MLVFVKENQGMRRILLMALALIVAMVGLVPQASKAQSSNMIRVMHASPDAPPVDIFVDGQAVLTNVPFFTLSGALSLPDGTYEVAIAPAGAGIDSAVYVTDLSVENGYAGTVVALNSLANLDVGLYDDDMSPTPAGQARVRIIHASPDAPAVDIKLAGTGTAVVSNAAFTDAATVEVPAGTYAFDITPAGSSTVVFTTPSLRFEAGWSYTLVATGFLKGGFWVQSRVDWVGGR
jgi:hypothetical protein